MVLIDKLWFCCPLMNPDTETCLCFVNKYVDLAHCDKCLSDLQIDIVGIFAGINQEAISSTEQEVHDSWRQPSHRLPALWCICADSCTFSLGKDHLSSSSSPCLNLLVSVWFCLLAADVTIYLFSMLLGSCLCSFCCDLSNFD